MTKPPMIMPDLDGKAGKATTGSWLHGLGAHVWPLPVNNVTSAEHHTASTMVRE